MSAIQNLKVVLCDPEGNVSIQGSDEDRKIIQESLAELEKQLELFVYDKIRRKDIDDVIDEFVEVLDFDAVIKWANLLEVEVNYPPIGDMYPDWQNELCVEVGDAMRKIGEP